MWGLLSSAICQKSSETSITASAIRDSYIILIRGLANHGAQAKFNPLPSPLPRLPLLGQLAKNGLYMLKGYLKEEEYATKTYTAYKA